MAHQWSTQNRVNWCAPGTTGTLSTGCMTDIPKLEENMSLSCSMRGDNPALMKRSKRYSLVQTA